MPVKNTPSHKTITKKPATKKLEDVQISETSTEEELIIAVPAKVKTPIELDEVESISVLDEKPESDPLAPDEEGDESALEEMGLEDEIDPFGDKWEA